MSLDEHGQTKTWLLSGWKISTGETSEVSATSSPTQDRPTFSRSELGAVLDTIGMPKANALVKSEDMLNQSKVEGTGSDTKRGAYDERLKRIILKDDADLTTIQHEFTHYWLQTILKNYKS